MTSAIGHLTVLAAFILSVIGAALAFTGGWRQRPDLAATGEKIALAVFGLVTLACGIMVYALVTHDFSVEYVAEVGSRQTPLYYTIISLWAALSGSILFWGFILSGYTAALILIHRGRYRNFMPYAVGTLMAISAFFLFVMAGPGNPFVYLPNPPSNGPGPNALLQNHPMMGLHPPLLYLGYVGLSVPFALAVGSLLARDTGPAALSLMRRWSLVSWLFLTLGVIAGMWWSYDVLGWGGYWSWDPVENVVLMPWLITTAFLHSLQVQERRHMLKAWTVSLIMCAFLLSIMGTFLTRSGVVDSVHSFTQSTIGPVFLVFLGVTMVLSVGLIALRARELAAPGTLDTLVSRESAFLLNNLLLVALTFTVLLGTLFPLIAEAVSGQTLSVGGPYYNQVAVPIALALLFLMGVGPLLPWGASELRDTLSRLIAPVAFAVATLVVLVTAGVRGAGMLLVFTLVAFVAASTVRAFASDVASRRRGTREPWITAGTTLVQANPRRYAGYLAHIGLLVVVIGIASSQAFTSSSEATLTDGQSMRLNGYTITLSHLQWLTQPNRKVMRAVLDVTYADTFAGTMSPSVNTYANATDPIVTPAVSTSPIQDLYLVLRGLSGTRSNRAVTIQAYTKPLVSWIWGGGAIIGLGAIMALMPRRRRSGVTVANSIADMGEAARPAQ
jgi:cytochrome c-type biogenesis protein CcmF